MLLKRRADLLIDGKYRRITIWDALDWKQNRPDLWEEYKNNIYSICKKPENKVRHTTILFCQNECQMGIYR